MVVFHSYASLRKGIWVGRSSPKVLQAPRFAAGPPLQLHPQGHEETFPALEEGPTFSQNVHQMNISYRCICEQIDPCSGCYISSGVCLTGSFRTQWTWQAAIALFYTRRGSWARMASHAWIVCMLSLRSLWHPPCPWYSSNHGHERGNFELNWFLLLELRLCT